MCCPISTKTPTQVVRAMIQKEIKGLIYSQSPGECATKEWRVGKIEKSYL